ncbi:MAG: copper chaperone PCu(A)C [Anaerolineales bacterium]|nr:copper chaperone PCu(A)C [Anaerolineales bacterium]MCX7609793.1 copper chaperone PCu(A)C [Anaerolineales bacterium]MDW8228006.1 copper chaperone PCu(A)C [Anaerolineales bacterium]
MKKLLVLILLLYLTACSRPAVNLSIEEAWARPGMAGGNSAVYFVIENLGMPDNLLAASSDVAKAVELHETVMEGDQMKMKHLHQVPIPAGEKTHFQPGGLHVMLIGLQRDLKVGDTFELTLTFQQAGDQTITVTVQQP